MLLLLVLGVAVYVNGGTQRTAAQKCPMLPVVAFVVCGNASLVRLVFADMPGRINFS